MAVCITPQAASRALTAPRLASAPQRQQAGAAPQPRVVTQKQALSGRTGIAQRRARAAAGRRQAAVVARAGGDVLVVGSSGQTAARVVVSLLRSGFKVTAGARGVGAVGVHARVPLATRPTRLHPPGPPPLASVGRPLLPQALTPTWRRARRW